jgi:hypothetical protein
MKEWEKVLQRRQEQWEYYNYLVKELRRLGVHEELLPMSPGEDVASDL